MVNDRSKFNKIERSSVDGFTSFLLRFNYDIKEEKYEFLIKAWKIYQREHELKIISHSNFENWLKWAIDNTVEAIELYPHHIDYIFEANLFDYDSLIKNRLKAIIH